MCRKPFNLEEIEQNFEIPKTSSDQWFWFYQSKRESLSYWAFDERTSSELERAFNENKDHVIVSIAGFPYYIDFVKLIQYSVHHPTRIRKIKRSNEMNDENFKVKGIAGVRLSTEESANSQEKNADTAETRDTNAVDENELSQLLSESLQVTAESNDTN